jgi:hypothetical protein
MSMTPDHESVRSVLTDGTTSEWLKAALQTALERDPVDAVNDALLLAGVLEERLRLLFDLAEPVETPDEED